MNHDVYRFIADSLTGHQKFLARWGPNWGEKYGNTEIYLEGQQALNFRALAELYGAKYNKTNKQEEISPPKQETNDVYIFESFEAVKECLLKFEELELCSLIEKQE